LSLATRLAGAISRKLWIGALLANSARILVGVFSLMMMSSLRPRCVTRPQQPSLLLPPVLLFGQPQLLTPPLEARPQAWA